LFLRVFFTRTGVHFAGNRFKTHASLDPEMKGVIFFLTGGADMDALRQSVIDATGLEPAIAKAAIGHVLLFLRDEAPEGHVAEFIDKSPQAHEAVQAAAATFDGGVTAAIEGLTSFMGHGRADVNILAGKLENLGLSENQIISVTSEIMAHAETLIGPDGAARIRQILPALAERFAGGRREI
jgi:hypothetical protein